MGKIEIYESIVFLVIWPLVFRPQYVLLFERSNMPFNLSLVFFRSYRPRSQFTIQNLQIHMMCSLAIQYECTVVRIPSSGVGLMACLTRVTSPVVSLFKLNTYYTIFFLVTSALVFSDSFLSLHLVMFSFVR